MDEAKQKNNVCKPSKIYTPVHQFFLSTLPPEYSYIKSRSSRDSDQKETLTFDRISPQIDVKTLIL